MNYVLFIFSRIFELFLPQVAFHTSSFLGYFIVVSPLCHSQFYCHGFSPPLKYFASCFFAFNHPLYLQILGNALLQLASHYQPTIAQYLQTEELLKTDHMHVFYLNCMKDAVSNCKNIMGRQSKSSSF